MPVTPEELLVQLAESPNHPYPKAIIEEMIQRSEEMTPALLTVLEDAGRHPKNYMNDGRWKVLDFAAYLLAQFRETRAFKPLCASLCHPEKVTDELWGDLITEDMGRILASVYDGDDRPLRDLVENRKIYEFVRGATVPKAYLCLLQAGKISRKDLEIYTGELLSGLLEREPSYAWDGWTGLCADLGFSKLVPLLKTAFEDNLCDPCVYGYEDLIRNAESGRDDGWKRNTSLIDDTLKETKGWNCWSKPEKTEKPKKLARKPEPGPIAPPGAEVSPQYIGPRTGPKTGRNDPCPCGSGKKFKKCCGTA